MRIVVLYSLLMATMLPTVSSWGILAHYQLNKEYIARVLCENRDKPELHCDGKCYLAKRLKAQQDRQDKETTERVQKMPIMQLFCQEGFQFSFGTKPDLTTLPDFVYLLPVYDSSFTRLLRPPRF